MGPQNDAAGASALRGWRFALVAAVFCASGGAALIYQVAWQRILAFHTGVGITSVSMIVAAFMAGLGIGSSLGGVASRRLSEPAALRAFAAIEIAIGLFALVSTTLYYDWLYLKAFSLYRVAWVAGGLHFAALVVPTTLMGMSLPLLVRAVVARSETAPRTIGALYGINVVGSAAGALATPFLLIRLLGIEGAIACGAAGNLLAGLTALALGRGRTTAAPAPPEPDHVLAGETRRPFALWIALYGFSGFVALSLEILWFRIMDVAIKSSAFTFGAVLSIFLIGLGAGSLVGSLAAPRLRRPLRFFLSCQTLLLVYAGAVLVALVAPPLDWPVHAWLAKYWRSYQGFDVDDLKVLLAMYVALPAVLYGPPTLLMGLSFAALQRAVQDDPRTSGFKVGVLQTANIVGSVAGSLFAGILLIDWLGTAATFRALVAAGVLFAAVGVATHGLASRFSILAPLMLALCFVMPDNEALWNRLHGMRDGIGRFQEDAAAVTGLLPTPDRHAVFVNGKGHSWIPFGGAHTLLGALPAAMHPSPGRVAIIGLGAGDTAWAAAFRTATHEVDVFEIAGAQERLLRRFAAESSNAMTLRSFLADPRVRIVAADGRHSLLQATNRYDVIEADALRPGSAYAGNLYSRDFFELVASRLAEGGLMCSWVPTARTAKGFQEAFAHVVSFPGQVMVGSNEPIPFEPEAWRARAVSPEAKTYFGAPLAEEVGAVIREAEVPPEGRFESLRVNRDLWPRDEFQTPLER